jgi:hypothetical protein
MITLRRSGEYRLIETKHNTKVLYLDKKAYVWIEPQNIGEILVTSRRTHRTDCVLSVGQYHIYKVVDEPALSDHLHMELQVGESVWQGYLLLTGLPTKSRPRTRIIPTSEVISENARFHVDTPRTRARAATSLRK